MKTVVILLISLSMYSCYHVPNTLNSNLIRADKNRIELEIFLKHYNNPSDSQKLKAAIFLIENMAGLQSIDTNSVRGNGCYFDIMEGLYKKYKKKYSTEILLRTVDSFNSSENIIPLLPNVKFQDDLKIVNSKFLIDNLDRAFIAWQESPWAQNISFDDFCEYILPYRCTNTYWEGSRKYFMERYGWIKDTLKRETNCFNIEELVVSDVDNWFNENNPLFTFKLTYLKPITFHNLIKGKWGDCADANSIKSTSLRAIGVPVAFDFIPQWGNHFAPHYFYKIIDLKHDTTKHLINNATNYFRNTTHIISGASQDHYDNFRGLPPELVIWYSKTIPKVFRKSYAIQKQSLAYIKSSSDIVPPIFSDPHLADVTKNYVECIDVVLKLPSPGKNKFVYLCVSQFDKWNPVQWAAIKDNIAIFKDMGKNIVYMPTYYENSVLIPAGNPFILNLDGKIQEIIPNFKQQSVKLFRKFPFYLGLVEKAGILCGTKFQGANSPDLSDTVTLFTINQIYYSMTDVIIKNAQNFRYLLYQFKDKKTDIAEIEFWSSEKGKMIKLHGKPIGNNGPYGYSIDKAMDGDWLSYFSRDTNESQYSYIGLDLGKNHKKFISKIRFCPRNDKNNITPDDVYELFYWDKRWISLGIQTATDSGQITFKNAPTNALFWLHDITEGKEERIFTYMDGKQYFW